jgi:hypothetical protein
MKYEKLTKAQLIAKILELENNNKINSEKAKNFDKLKLQNDILENARKEDKEKVEKAELILSNFQNREQELVNQFETQKMLMKRDLDGQNEAMVNLFKMTDATINLQILYYNSFKNIFINEQPPIEKGDE